MSHRSYHRRNKIDGPFAPRLIKMLKSPAYRVLSLSAHRVLARIEIELYQHGGDDNGNLKLTYDHLVEYGVDRDAIAPAIRELAGLGFIEVTERGRGGAGSWHEPNRFRLTYRPVGNARPTHEWQHIETTEQAAANARAARKHPPPKTEPQSGKTAVSSPENSDWKGPLPVRETPTTARSGKARLPLYLGYLVRATALQRPCHRVMLGRNRTRRGRNPSGSGSHRRSIVGVTPVRAS